MWIIFGSVRSFVGRLSYCDLVVGGHFVVLEILAQDLIGRFFKIYFYFYFFKVNSFCVRLFFYIFISLLPRSFYLRP